MTNLRVRDRSPPVPLLLFHDLELPHLMIPRTFLRTAWASAVAGSLMVSAGAQAQRYVVDTFTELEGLGSPRVRDLAQDADGLLWVLTSVGLDRWDGSSWQRFEPSESMFRQISFLEPDPVRGVWLLAGLDLLSVDETGVLDRIRLPVELRAAEVTAFSVSRQPASRPSMAIGTARRGVHLWSGEAWIELGPGEDSPEAEILSLAWAGDTLFVGTSEGMYTVAGDRLRVVPWAGEAPQNRRIRALAPSLERVSGPDPWVVGEDWIAGYEEDRLVRIASLDEPLEPLERGHATTATPDPAGGLYFGTTGRLSLYDPESPRGIVPLGAANGLVGDGATTLLTDREGNVWVGTLRGVSVIKSRSFTSFDSDHGLLADEVSAIEPYGAFLALGHGSGLTLWDEPVAVRIPLDFPDSGRGRSRVLDLETDPRGDLWIAFGHGGLLRLEESREVVLVSRGDGAGSINAVLSTRDGLLVGASKGLFRLRGDDLVREGDPGLRDVYVRRLVEGRGRALYVLTAGQGLFVRNGTSWKRIPGADEPGPTNLYSLLEDSHGRVWVGGARGLFLLRDGALQPPGQSGPRIGRPVYQLLEDSRGDLWIGTDFGIHRWNGEDLQYETARTGLAGNETNRDAIHEGPGGRVWIGTEGGLTRYDHRLEHSRRAPPVVDLLESARVGEPGPWTSQGGSVVFRLRAVSLGRPERILYRMRLEGLEAGWREVAGPTVFEAHYPGLRGGEYRLRFQARTDLSDWSSEVVSAPVVVPVPLWRRGWVLVLIAAALVGLALVLRRAARQRHRARGLEAAVEEQRAELADQRAKFRSIVENLAECILITDFDDVVLYASPQVERFFGYRPEDLTGRPAHSLFAHAKDREKVESRIAARRRGESERYEVQLGHANGERRWVEIRAAPYRDPAGRIVGTLGSITDIGERKQLEERLSRSQRLQAVGQLAGGVAHDFNNLLTIIGGAVELLETEGGASGSPYLGDIRAAADRAASLTRQLLAFSRRQMLAPTAMNLNEVVTGAASILRRTFFETIEIRLDLAEDLGPVVADPTQIEQVVVNLAVNARDAMPEGGVLRITTSNETLTAPRRFSGFDLPAGAWVKLMVEDSGVGMPPEVREHAFEPFFTTRSEQGGTGLGLATVYGIVKQSGGYVNVESVVGEGTTFSIFLPRSRKGDQAIEASKPERGREPLSSPGRITVLLAEDEGLVRRLFVSVLTAEGFDVLAAADGRKALEIASTRNVDLLVTDLVMPRMGGRELARRLRAENDALPILFVSGYDSANPLEESSGERMSFLQKPVPPSRLVLEVKRLLADVEEGVQRASKGSDQQG